MSNDSGTQFGILNWPVLSEGTGKAFTQSAATTGSYPEASDSDHPPGDCLRITPLSAWLRLILCCSTAAVIWKRKTWGFLSLQRSSFLKLHRHCFGLRPSTAVSHLESNPWSPVICCLSLYLIKSPYLCFISGWPFRCVFLFDWGLGENSDCFFSISKNNWNGCPAA